MSQENVDLVRQGYEHFARTGEPDASLYAADIEMAQCRRRPRAGGLSRCRGSEEADRGSCREHFRTEPFEFLDAGDRVVAGLIHRGRGKGSSAEVEMREWNVFLIRAGRIASVHEYSERERALEAAGLSE